MLYSIGVLGVALGLGFMAASVASFIVSRRLGLVPPSSATTGGRPQE
jgi:hypothetical protein